MTEASRHKLTAILYADVDGYSRLTGQDEIGTHERVMAMLDFASQSIEKGEGKVLRYAGDAILAEFSSVLQTVNTAIKIQNSLAEENTGLDEADCLQIRIGINLGEVIQDRGEIYGDGVNLAARLEAAAEPGGLCISATVYEQVKGKIPIEFGDGGRQTFKNIADPVQVYHWHPKAADSSAVPVSRESSDIMGGKPRRGGAQKPGFIPGIRAP